MDIIEQLYENGTRFGFTVRDGDDTYAIPNEGLYVNTIYKTLVDSGYKLINEKDYEMIRNGTKLSALPIVEDKAANHTKDFETMLRLPCVENLQVSTTPDTYVGYGHPASYPINTREEFLRYLRSTRYGVDGNDFYPLNYIVSPSALFTLEEFVDIANDTYVRDIANRRNLSYSRYKKLKAWVAEKLGKELNKITHTDVEEVYYSYGIDGVNLGNLTSITSRGATAVNPFYHPTIETTYKDAEGREISTDKDIVDTRRVRAGFYRTITLLAGSDKYTPMRPDYMSDFEWDSFLENKCFATNTVSDQTMKEHEYRAIDYLVPSLYVCFDLTFDSGVSVIVTPLAARMYGTIQTSDLRTIEIERNCAGLHVMNPAMPGVFVEVDDWDRGDVFFEETALLTAGISSIFEKRVPPKESTDFQILLDMGLSPSAAVEYIANQDDIYLAYKIKKNEDDEGSGEAQLILKDDIDAFFFCEDEEDVQELDLPTYGCEMPPAGDRRAVRAPVLVDSAEKEARMLYVTPGSDRVQCIQEIIDGERGAGRARMLRDSIINPDVSAKVRAMQAVSHCFGISVANLVQICRDFGNEMVDNPPTPEEIDADERGTRDLYKFMRINNGEDFIMIGEFTRPWDVTMEAERLKLSLESKRLVEANVFYQVEAIAYELTNDPVVTKRHIGVRGCAIVFDSKYETVEPKYDNPVRKALLQLERQFVMENKDVIPDADGILERSHEIGEAAFPIFITKLVRRVMLAYGRSDGSSNGIKLEGEALSKKESYVNGTEIYRNGKFAIPTSWWYQWGGLEQSRTIKAHTYSFEDSLVNIARDSVFPNAKAYGPVFRSVCVNATVRINEVIPDGNSAIDELPLRMVAHEAEVMRAFGSEDNSSEFRRYLGKNSGMSSAYDTWCMPSHLNLINLLNTNTRWSPGESEVYSDQSVYQKAREELRAIVFPPAGKIYTIEEKLAKMEELYSNYMGMEKRVRDLISGDLMFYCYINVFKSFVANSKTLSEDSGHVIAPPYLPCMLYPYIYKDRDTSNDMARLKELRGYTFRAPSYAERPNDFNGTPISQRFIAVGAKYNKFDGDYFYTRPKQEQRALIGTREKTKIMRLYHPLASDMLSCKDLLLFTDDKRGQLSLVNNEGRIAVQLTEFIDDKVVNTVYELNELSKLLAPGKMTSDRCALVCRDASVYYLYDLKHRLYRIEV